MKACSAVLEGIEKVHLLERQIEPAPDQILVKTHSASICLSELQWYRKGYYIPSRQLKFPVYLGHEGGGTVVQVGSRVHEYREGDKVICMHDPEGDAPGCIADYWIARPIDVVPAPEGMDMDLACLGETFNPFIAVVFRSGVKLGDDVAVTGANFIGQIIAQGMKRSGALEVTVIDDRDFRLDVAKKLGADHIINSTKVNAYEAAIELTGGKGFDVVAQTAAYTDPTVEDYINLATEIVRPGGVIIFQGDFLHPVTINNIHRWHHYCLDIRNLGWRHQNPLLVQAQSPACLKVLHHGLVQVKPLITSTFPLEKVGEAFRVADEDPNQIKVVLKP